MFEFFTNFACCKNNTEEKKFDLKLVLSNSSSVVLSNRD